MKYNFLYYITLITGIVVVLVGIQNLYLFWGDLRFTGLIGQAAGVICLIGGGVNFVVAYKFKKLVNKIRKIKEPELVDL